LLTVVLGIGLSAAAVLVTDRILAAVAEWTGAGLLFVAIALAQFGGIAAFICRRLGGPTWRAGMSMFVGIPIGVLTDAMFDWVYNSKDRNLFPFEILVFWIIALAPALMASLSTDALDRMIGLGSRNGRRSQ
jgi:hypothetical protein